ncbi:MAG: guanylate kinase [Lachnospiraceae bacterium]|nr:guanylate kinase [Lachnospiraceae bacterium]
MKGLLIVVSGFSGVGKGTIVKELLRRYPDVYELSISVTTRRMRLGEEEGREYFFRSREVFEEMIRNGDLLEHAVYNGNYYGTPKPYVLEKLSEGKNVILEIEMQGGAQIKRVFPEAQLLYIVPPNAKELFERLKHRNTETPEEIHRRLKRAIEETAYMPSYDFVVVNDDLEACIQEVHALFEHEREVFDERQRLAEKLKEQLVEITEEESYVTSVL